MFSFFFLCFCFKKFCQLKFSELCSPVFAAYFVGFPVVLVPGFPCLWWRKTRAAVIPGSNAPLWSALPCPRFAFVLLLRFGSGPDAISAHGKPISRNKIVSSRRQQLPMWQSVKRPGNYWEAVGKWGENTEPRRNCISNRFPVIENIWNMVNDYLDKCSLLWLLC